MTAFKSCLYILVIGPAAASCVAQERTKVTLSGTVVNPSGAAVPHAQLSIKPTCQCSDCPDPQLQLLSRLSSCYHRRCRTFSSIRCSLNL